MKSGAGLDPQYWSFGNPLEDLSGTSRLLCGMLRHRGAAPGSAHLVTSLVPSWLLHWQSREVAGNNTTRMPIETLRVAFTVDEFRVPSQKLLFNDLRLLFICLLWSGTRLKPLPLNQPKTFPRDAPRAEAVKNGLHEWSSSFSKMKSASSEYIHPPNLSGSQVSRRTRLSERSHAFLKN